MAHMGLPSLGRNIKARAAWSVSYADSSKYAQLQQKIQARDLAPYDNGNPRSDDFFKRFEASMAETERLRQCCRRAASQSVSRNQEEKVSMESASRSIDDAKAVAFCARSATVGPILEEHFQRVVSDPPATLGHLRVPKLAIEEALPSARELPASAGVAGEGAASEGAAQPRVAPETQPPLAPPPLVAEAPPALMPAETVAAEQRAAAEQRPVPKNSSRPSSSRPSTSRRSNEEEKLPAAQDFAAIKEKKNDRSSPGSTSSSDFASSSIMEEEEASSDGGWPPRPPLLRFKMRLQFSSRFKPSEEKALFEHVNSDISKKLMESERRELQDMTIGWFNMLFRFAIATEFEFEVGFPIIILTVLDAIYPKRVRWREVDWRLQYKVALEKNYAVLQTIWSEVNMDKAREFRYSSLHVEDMVAADVRHKLNFLKLMKHWFDNRIHSAPPYDAMAKRREFVERCRVWGHRIKFPPWIQFEKEAPPLRRSLLPTAYDQKPEFERLICFLGSTEHQTM